MSCNPIMLYPIIFPSNRNQSFDLHSTVNELAGISMRIALDNMRI